MKKSKIIAPALGVLILSTAASISGTVAWFTANRTVTASGMSVSAQASSDLYIVNGALDANDADAWAAAPADIDAFVTAATAQNNNPTAVNAMTNNGATTLIPSSTSNYSKWFYLTDDSDIEVGGGIYSDTPTQDNIDSKTYDPSDVDAINEYVHISRCYLGLKETTANVNKGTLTVKATFGSTEDHDGLLPVLRCAVVISPAVAQTDNPAVFSSDGDTTTKPLADGQITVEQQQVAGVVVNSTATATTQSGNFANLKAEFLSNVVYTVTTFIWFEGQDSACINRNAIDSTNYTVALEFKLGAAVI